MEILDYNKQAKDFLKSTGVKFKCEFLYNGKHFSDDREMRDVYRVSLVGLKNSYIFNFGQSISHSSGSGDVQKPNEYDVLSCLTNCDPGAFEDFCSEFGYNSDSKKDERIYDAVVNEWMNVKMLWNDEDLERLREIW